MVCLSPNRHLFTLAQNAGRQTGACLLSRKLCSAKQAPVYSRAGWSNSNRRLFTLAQIAWRQTGTCLPSRRLRSLKQALVYPRANCVAPNRRLFSDTKSRSMVLAKFEVLQSQRRSQPPPSQLNEPTAVWGKPSGCRCGWRRRSGGLPRWRTRCCGCGAARRDSVRSG